MLQFPIPTAARCYKLGKALRRAIESYPEDIDVAVVATGGLSHQVHGEGAGFNNPEWDHQFLDAITDDPAALTRMTHAEYARLGGFEGAEVIMWLVMRGALSDNGQAGAQLLLPAVDDRHRHRWCYENEAAELDRRTVARAAPAPDGRAARTASRRLTGTYPFDIARSVKGYRINKFLHELIDPEHRARLPRRTRKRALQGGRPHRRGAGPDPAARLARHDPLRRHLLHAGEARRRDRRLQPARLRGDARRDAGGLPQDPQHARCLYSVAGKDTPNLAWDKAPAD